MGCTSTISCKWKNLLCKNLSLKQYWLKQCNFVSQKCMTTDNKNKQQKCDGITFTTDTIPLMWQLYCFFFLLKTLKQTSKEQYLYLKTFCKSQLKLYLLLGLQIQTAQLFKIIIQQPPFKRKQSFQNCRFF